MSQYPETLFDVYKLYLEEISAAQLPGFKTALLRYTVSGYLECPLDLCSSLTESDLADRLRQIPTEKLKDATQVQEQVFELHGISSNSRRTYRSHLKRFLTWCGRQRWWRGRPKSLDYAPRKRSIGVNHAEVRLTDRRRLPWYKLPSDKLTPLIQRQLDEFNRFWSQSHMPVRQNKPLRQITLQTHTAALLRMLGWLHFHKGIPTEELSLEMLIPGTDVDDVAILVEHLDWLVKERQTRQNTLAGACVTAVALAKYLFHKQTNYPQVRNFQDVPVIQAIRSAHVEARVAAKNEPSSVKPELKEMTFEEYIQVVERLKLCCAERSLNGSRRSDRAIAWSKQLYLICAFLRYVPDRQRTLRELEVGRTLFKEKHEWVIRQRPQDYKTGDTYGSRVIPFPPELVADLEEWLEIWRPKLSPAHPCVFSQLNGKPFNDVTLSASFRGAVYRTSYQIFGRAVALTPHRVRNMAIQHFADTGATDAEMESLALLMAHSRQMQRTVYDNRTYQQKTQAGLTMLKNPG